MMSFVKKIMSYKLLQYFNGFKLINTETNDVVAQLDPSGFAGTWQNAEDFIQTSVIDKITRYKVLDISGSLYADPLFPYTSYTLLTDYTKVPVLGANTQVFFRFAIPADWKLNSTMYLFAHYSRANGTYTRPTAEHKFNTHYAVIKNTSSALQSVDYAGVLPVVGYNEVRAVNVGAIDATGATTHAGVVGNFSLYMVAPWSDVSVFLVSMYVIYMADKLGYDSVPSV